MQRSTRRMAVGALIVAGAYLLLGGVDRMGGGAPAGWPWLVLFFVIFTFGELFILPTGLGLFARLAPIGFGATTVAAWYLSIFSGSLAAGLVGRLWSEMSHAAYFALLAGIAAVAALLLWFVDPLLRDVDARRKSANESL